MADKKKKYYVVWKGHKPGIYKTWSECQEQIKKFKGPQYISFESQAEAEKAFKGKYYDFLKKGKKKRTLTAEQLKRIGKPNPNAITVDAAVSGNPGKLEYRGVDLQTRKQIFRQGPFEDGTNNIGEFLAIVHGLAWLKKRGSNKLIYTDSKTTMGWVKKKKCNTKLQANEKNAELFTLVTRAENWLAKNAFTTVIVKWETEAWGEIPADFGRK